MSDPKHPVSIDELSAQANAGPGLFTVVWRRKGLLLLGLTVGVILGTIYYFQQTPKFQSSADLVVWKRRADPVSPGGSQDSRVAVIEDYVGTQSTMMRSHEVLLKAASILEKNRSELRSLPQAPPEALVGYIQAGLNISRPKDPAAANSNSPGNILNVSWRGGSPEDCPKIVDAVIAGFKLFLGVEVDSAHEEKIRRVKLDIEQTNKSIAETTKSRKEVLAKIQLQSSVSLSEIRTRIALFETKLIELKEKQIELDSRLKQIQRGIAEKKDPRLLMVLFQLTSNKSDTPARPVVEGKQTDDALFNLRLQEEEMLQNYGPDHPQVLALRKRMTSIKEYLEKNTGQQVGDTATSPEQLIQLYVQILEEDRKKFEETQKNIRENLAADNEIVRSMDSLVNEEASLKKRLETFDIKSALLAQELTGLQNRQDAPLFDARVINPAGVGFKVAPVMSTSISFGAMLGLLVGLGLAFLAEFSDQSFRSPEEIRRRLGVSVIGHIPPMVAHEATDEYQKRLDPMLIVHHRPKSVEAESFRGLRTSLYFSTVGKGHQLIQVTSPNPGDGKSTLTANLAAVIAQSGKRVILIDCDFRKPRVHKIFGLESNEVGLSSILLGESELGQAIQSCGVPGLDLLPCGARPTNPAELLSSQQYRDFLDQIRTMYDFVLIDTPPLLAVSDPAVVATQVDGVLLCTRLSKTARPAAERAKDILTSMGANLLGVLVNDSEAMARGYDSYGGTGYNYQYQYSADYADEDSSDATSSPRKSR